MKQTQPTLSPPVSLSTEDPNHNAVSQLNQHCQQHLFNPDTLREHLNAPLLYQMLTSECPTLFADAPVFMTHEDLQKQLAIIAAIEHVIALPAYQERVLAYAPKTAQFIPKAHSVFFGYDFHLSPTGPKLIEINTNAGGGLLGALATRHQVITPLSSTDHLSVPATFHSINAPDSTFITMFIEEWQAEHADKPLRSIAIVDDAPESQYLLPEFLLFKKLFEAQGIKAIICDPAELSYHDQTLWHHEQAIDLVYNRLTDFGLESPHNSPLQQAYLERTVVITPHPRAHALYANKRNLSLLTDETALLEMGVDADTRTLLLNGIAQTVLVNPNDADSLWINRKQLFFKPTQGFGSKAAYRGDKLTKRVFSELLQHDYVAQTLVPPSVRYLTVDAKIVSLKFDLRHYVYQGETQLLIARLYQGQTTNFRTPGGGFAQVIIVSCQNEQSPLA